MTQKPSPARSRRGKYATIFVTREFRDTVAQEAQKKGISSTALVMLAVEEFLAKASSDSSRPKFVKSQRPEVQADPKTWTFERTEIFKKGALLP